jgi:hypothetical protein
LGNFCLELAVRFDWKADIAKTWSCYLRVSCNVLQLMLHVDHDADIDTLLSVILIVLPCHSKTSVISFDYMLYKHFAKKDLNYIIDHSIRCSHIKFPDWLWSP